MNDISFWKTLIENSSEPKSMYRGVNAFISDGDLVPFKFRKKPKDTIVPFHNYVNIKSKEKFGVPIRNLVFATLSWRDAQDYGQLFAVVPQGEFIIFYSTLVKDFTLGLSLMPVSVTSELILMFANMNSVYDKKQDYNYSSILLKISQTETMDELKIVLLEILKPYTTDIEPEVVVDKYISRKMKILDEYIDSIVAINSLNQLHDVGVTELMIYSPNGLKYYDPDPLYKIK